MFNRINIRLLKYVLFYGLFLISACTENKHNNSFIADKSLNTSTDIKKEKTSEYIIVLNKGITITTALSGLKIYNVHLIKNLKRGRYLVGLTNYPGVEKLKKDSVSSKYIKHIQPNFIYTTQ